MNRPPYESPSAITRRNAWKMLGLASAVPIVTQTRDAVASGVLAQSSAANSATPQGVNPATPFTPAVIPEVELAGQGGSAPQKLLRLDGTNATLLLVVRRRGLPEIAYWGRRLPAMEARQAFAARATDIPDNGPDNWRPLITLLDTIGGWNFDMPALVASRPDGTGWTAEFDTTAMEAKPGGLVILAADVLSQIRLRIELSLGVDDVLKSVVALTNASAVPLDMQRLASGTFLLPEDAGNFQVTHGAWAAEFGLAPTTLTNGGLVVESRRNRSHDHYPAILAGSAGITENTGEGWAFLLGWSGGHRIVAERMEDARIRVTLSDYLYPGEGMLAPGEARVAPPAYAVYSQDGMAGIARACQSYVRNHLLRWPGNKMKPRPVLLNSWEGNGFNLNEARLMAQVDAAAKLGIERFVLDDGWFGARRSPKAGLGDWTAATSIFPQGLRALSDRVHNRGMEFGLWYEPEMANPDSDIYRAHPEWALQVRGRPMLTSRHQIVLDISRPEVSDHLFTIISQEISDWHIDYIKWDFNRDLLDAADADGRAAYRRQVLALYALWDRLHAAHPGLEIESCASGGGRSDWGAVAHTQRVWTSDNSSAIDRLRIQNNAWHFLPPEITGCHISASPNGIDGRSTTLDYRAAIAMFGHLGIELDPLLLKGEELDRLKAWIALHKRLRPVLHHGVAQFANAHPSRVVRGVTSKDGVTGIFLVAQKEWPTVRRSSPVFLPGLDSQRNYRVTIPAPQGPQGLFPAPDQQNLLSTGMVFSGAVLSGFGIFLPDLLPQSALVLECLAV